MVLVDLVQSVLLVVILVTTQLAGGHQLLDKALEVDIATLLETQQVAVVAQVQWVLIQQHNKMVALVVPVLIHMLTGEVYLQHLPQLVLAFQVPLLVVVVVVVHLHTELLRKHSAVVVVRVMAEQ
jgi:hypothetical protein